MTAIFAAYQTGSAYAPTQGPGSVFPTDDQAMIAGAMYAETQSLLNDGNEQCGMTFVTAGGQYSYTSAVHGDWDGCQPLDAMGAIPAGSIPEGGYHSHGAYDPAYENERFSGQTGDNVGGDVMWSLQDLFNLRALSVATPGGNVMIYYPTQACQAFFLGGPIGTGTTIPICGW